MLEARDETGIVPPAEGGAGRGPRQDPVKRPVLIVLHQERSNPGHVGQVFARNGHALDVRRPRFGDPLPATLAAHCGAVIFGGPMSANDKDEFIIRETRWIGVALKEGKPFLGICLGAQMLVTHLGGRVGFHGAGMVEVGYYPLLTTAEAAALGPFPRHVYQWHREGCALWRGAQLLATSDGPFPNQAFACGSAVGVQFHPEITHAQIHRRIGHSSRLDMPGARPREEHIAGHLAHGPEVRAWLDRFLQRWLSPSWAAQTIA
jgi:GMP synthase (glutamine-hydrolysing)